MAPLSWRSLPLFLFIAIIGGYTIGVYLFAKPLTDAYTNTHSLNSFTKSSSPSALAARVPAASKAAPVAAIAVNTSSITPSPSSPPFPDPAAVPVEFFVMSMCPDAYNAEAHFFGVMREIFPIIDMRIVSIQDQEGNTFHCKHGEPECRANRAQLCLQEHWRALAADASSGNSKAPIVNTKDNAMYNQAGDSRKPVDYFNTFLDFILCSNSRVGGGLPHNEAACARASNINEAALKQCADKESDGFMSEAARRVKESGLRRSCTITINGAFWCKYDGGTFVGCSEGDRPADLIKAVCKRYKGTQKIQACQSV